MPQFLLTFSVLYLRNIWLLFAGRVIDQGEHSALMNRNELYCTLIQTWLQETEELSTNPRKSEIETPIEYNDF